MKLLSLVVLFSVMLTSCSVFQGSRKMDMSPFAENTRTLFAEAIKIERPFQYKNLQTYTTMPELQKARIIAAPILKSLKGIIYYSNQLVAINNARLSEKDKNRMLVSYLNEQIEKTLAEKRSDSLRVDISTAKTILENIKNAKTYLDGLSAAEPIVNSVVTEVLERIDEFQNLIPLIIAGFDKGIEDDYKAVRENYKRLHKLQEEWMLSVTRLYNARIGDQSELKKLLEENASLRYFIPSADKANHDNLVQAENFLLGQVKEVELLLQQLDDIKVEYIVKQDEVVAWRNEIDSKILVARTSLTIWARAHKNLGAGIPVPPMIDVAGIAGNLAGNVVKTVVP